MYGIADSEASRDFQDPKSNRYERQRMDAIQQYDVAPTCETGSTRLSNRQSARPTTVCSRCAKLVRFREHA
jgi:hypothetical protein